MAAMLLSFWCNSDNSISGLSSKLTNTISYNVALISAMKKQNVNRRVSVLLVVRFSIYQAPQASNPIIHTNSRHNIQWLYVC
jgi:hypothetical protein